MSCKDRLECERLRNIEHAKLLASQEANITGAKLAVVKLHHHLYGDYYKGIPYKEAVSKKLKIYDYFERGKTMKKEVKKATKTKKSAKSSGKYK